MSKYKGGLLYFFLEEACQVDEQIERQHQDDQDKYLMQVGFPDKKTITSKSGLDYNELGNILYLSTNLFASIQRPQKYESFGYNMVDNLDLYSRSSVGKKYDNECAKLFFHTEYEKTTPRVKPYGYKECGKTLRQKKGLSLHQRIKNGEKPFECTA